MNRTPVKSSNVAAVGYDAETRSLEVEFTNGSVYQYVGVPANTHAELMAAPSVGGFLAGHVKGRYEVKRQPDVVK